MAHLSCGWQLLTAVQMNRAGQRKVHLAPSAFPLSLPCYCDWFLPLILEAAFLGSRCILAISGLPGTLQLLGTDWDY